MSAVYDDSVPISLTAYREMVAQRDKFRDEAKRLQEYERAWMRLPVACRQGHDPDSERGCGYENCTDPDCQA